MLNENLLALRKKSGLTQADVARHLKITRQAYSCYESNRREMDFASLVSIADFYNVTTDYLLDRGKTDKLSLAKDEIMIIEKYRALDSRGKDSVKATLDSEFFHSVERKTKKL